MRYGKSMSEALADVREGFTPKQIKMAIGVASDKRYAGGNMTGAVKAIEKIKKGLSDHPQVAAVLKRQNEKLDQEDEPFVKDLVKKLRKGSATHGKQADDLEKAVNEAKFSDDMINKLKKAYEPMRGKKINPTPLMKIFDKIDSNKDGLEQLYKADIPFVSMMAMSRLMLKHNYKADDINKLGKIRREDFVLDEAINEMKEPFAVVDTADGNKVVGTASDEKGAKSIITSAELPPMKIKDKKTLKIVKVKKKQDIGYPLKEEETVIESWELDEMKMDDPKLLKIFDKLKKGSTVKIKIDSSISKGKDYREFTVTAKNIVGKGKRYEQEKITLKSKDNPTGVKHFLYNRDNKVTLAIGDMGASIADIKEDNIMSAYTAAITKQLGEK